MKLLWTLLCVSVSLGLAAVLDDKIEAELQTHDVDVEAFDKNVPDACSEKHCGKGHECDLDEDGTPVCVCIKTCGTERDEGGQVCSTQNVTFTSECELHRQKCLCHTGSTACLDAKFIHAHLDYLGPCKEIARCTDSEMKQYPKRMREWLFIVMKELARRKKLSEPAMKLAEKVTKQVTKHWVMPVIWKFCDLDRSHDKVVVKSELLPISAPLKPLEHCTGPFLDSCDIDASGQISLEEWGLCLGLDPEDIQDLCETLRN